MIGQKITKPVSDWNAYTQVALWCNTNGATIEDRGNCYEIVALPEPPEPTLDEAKAENLSEINAACDRILNEAVSTYPETEILTFDQQTAEAKAYQASGQAEDAPLLSALAQGRGMALDELAKRVIAKHQAFSALSGSVIGQRQALEDRLDACTSVEDVQSLAVEIVIPDITGGTVDMGASGDADTPVAFVEQHPQSVYDSAGEGDGQTE